MAISVTCDSCGKTLRAKDSAAGRQTKCPECGYQLVIPSPPQDVYDAEEDAYPEYHDEPAGEGWSSSSYGSGTRGSADATRQCPVCAETIKAVAVKCRYCGEIFDPAMKRRQKSSGSGDLATPGSRLAAVLIDGLVNLPAVIAAVAGAVLIQGRQKELGAVLVGIGVLAVLAVGIYQLVILSRDGQTIGKRFMGIRIVKYDDNSNPGFVSAVLLRGFVNGLIGGIPLLGPIYSLADILFIFGEERRCLHDMLAGTQVVEA